jgi:hypothetical protein
MIQKRIQILSNKEDGQNKNRSGTQIVNMCDRWLDLYCQYGTLGESG